MVQDGKGSENRIQEKKFRAGRIRKQIHSHRGQRQDAEESLRILEPYGLRLTDAAHAIVERLQKALKSETVKDAIARMINEQRARYQRDNISKRHFRNIHGNRQSIIERVRGIFLERVDGGED